MGDELLVLAMNDGAYVGNIVAAPALARNMERLVGVLREAREEELEERIHVLRRLVCGRDRRGQAVVCIGEADLDGLVEEDDVRVRIPALLVKFCAIPSVDDTTGPQFP
jgi:hypothetical protein